MAEELWIDVSNWSGIYNLSPDMPHRAMSAGRPKGLFNSERILGGMVNTLTDSTAQQMKDTGVHGVVVGTQNYDIAMAQMESSDKVGLAIANYVYLLFLQDYVAQMDAAMKVASQVDSRFLSLDAEDPNAEKLTERQTLDFLWNCANYCVGKKNTNIYTGPYWWARQTGNSDEFSKAGFGVWHSAPNGTPGIVSIDYGGWKLPMAVQWEFDHTVAGVNADMNTFFVPDPTPPTPQPQPIVPNLTLQSSNLRLENGVWIVESRLVEAGK